MRAGYVGKAVDRVDARTKVTGAAKYPADFYFEDMLHIKVLRAPHPHARIKKIDVEKARALEGVELIITGEDVDWLKKFGLIFKDQEVLVREKTRYMGDALAIVAADSERTARRALRLIQVDYEELEVLGDPLRAMEADAPYIHEPPAESCAHQYNPANVLCVHHLNKGDVDKGFAEADYIFENQYTTSHIEHVALQPESGVAVYDQDTGKLRLWAATQWLHDAQADIAQCMGMSPEQVEIIQPAIGGAFGKREDLSVHLPLAVMAKLTGRPVKMVMTRGESMIAQSKRHPAIYRFKTGVKKDGTLTAWQTELISDTGAYASSGPAVVHQGLYVSTGPYNVENVRGVCYTVYTNNTYSGAMRGFGATQSAFAYESHIDYIAKELGLDPAQFRLKNCFRPGSVTANGQKLTTSVAVAETIETARERFGSKGTPSSPRKRRGMGMATIMFGCGYGEGFPDHSIVNLEVTEEGRIRVKSAAADVGQGVKTVVAQIVAEVLNLPLDLIELAEADSVTMKNAGSTSATRQTIFTGNAAKIAAEQLLAKIFHRASMELCRHHPELSVKDGEIILHGTDRQMTLADLAKVARVKQDPLAAEGCFFPHTDVPDEQGQGELVYVAYTFNTQFVEVEVDTETGQVDVLRVVAAPDIGKAINPMGVEGQSEGGTAMGMGMALMEQQVFKDGITVNPDLGTYLIPTTMDVPDIETIIVESGDACGPYGAKGIGEPAMIPTAPAIINAIEDAVGVRITDLPATPEKILAALAKTKNGGEA
ncbi:MAG: xanthine dehydrogenase family protein molybdopterin-binding subunit [Firmicutes bacterium]|nr:xanthine dehydrogenase family protein molybdopterin-binding subunit [Bacillota bacterium]